MRLLLRPWLRLRQRLLSDWSLLKRQRSRKHIRIKESGKSIHPFSAKMKLYIAFLLLIAALTAEAQRQQSTQSGPTFSRYLKRALNRICEVRPSDVCSDGEKGHYRKAENGSCTFEALADAPKFEGGPCSVIEVNSFKRLWLTKSTALFIFNSH